MVAIYSDYEIQLLIDEPKGLPTNWHTLFRNQPKRGHDERELNVPCGEGKEFIVILRKSQFNPLDFSVILGLRTPQLGRIFRLRRYNGKSHEHTNRLEQQTFYDFHIHLATERYQQLGDREPREDAFAEVTDRYSDATGALECLLSDANFQTNGRQTTLFLAGPEV